MYIITAEILTYMIYVQILHISIVIADQFHALRMGPQEIVILALDVYQYANPPANVSLS